MKFLQRVEAALEDLIEGRLMEAIDPRVHPTVLLKRCTRMMRDPLRFGKSGPYAPNHFRVTLSAADWEGFSRKPRLPMELAGFLEAYAAEEGLGLLGPARLEFLSDDSLSRGRVRVEALHADSNGSPVRAVLFVKEGFGKGKVLPLAAERVTLGRSAEAGLQVADPGVSGIHCSLAAAEEGFRIRDEDSRNGIRVNGEPVKETALHEGDVIAMGHTELELRLMPEKD